MKKLLATCALGVFISTALHASETASPLIIELSDPMVRITIPGMAGIDMEPPTPEHPPMFKLHGQTETASVSVITPSIEEAVSPMACASAIANMLLAQETVTREHLFLGRANEQTFLIIYGFPLEESVLLNTHIVSAAGSAQCVEAHVSRVSTADSDVEPWFNGFGDASIEEL